MRRILFCGCCREYGGGGSLAGNYSTIYRLNPLLNREDVDYACVNLYARSAIRSETNSGPAGVQAIAMTLLKFKVLFSEYIEAGVHYVGIVQLALIGGYLFKRLIRSEGGPVRPMR